MPGAFSTCQEGPQPVTCTPSLPECMNCSRLSDMSDRLTTLEAKVRQLKLAGPGILGRAREQWGDLGSTRVMSWLGWELWGAVGGLR